MYQVPIEFDTRTVRIITGILTSDCAICSFADKLNEPNRDYYRNRFNTVYTSVLYFGTDVIGFWMTEHLKIWSW